MPNYLTKVRVDYAFEIQADNEEDAKRLALQYDYLEYDECFDGIYEVLVTEDK